MLNCYDGIPKGWVPFSIKLVFVFILGFNFIQTHFTANQYVVGNTLKFTPYIDYERANLILLGNIAQRIRYQSAKQELETNNHIMSNTNDVLIIRNYLPVQSTQVMRD